jgi:hypothetical protein
VKDVCNENLFLVNRILTSCNYGKARQESTQLECYYRYYTIPEVIQSVWITVYDGRLGFAIWFKDESLTFKNHAHPNFFLPSFQSRYKN